MDRSKLMKDGSTNKKMDRHAQKNGSTDKKLDRTKKKRTKKDLDRNTETGSTDEKTGSKFDFYLNIKLSFLTFNLLEKFQFRKQAPFLFNENRA